MRAWRFLRPVGAALCFGATFAGTASAGANENELWTCMTELLRQTPSWRAMRDARVEMQQKGFQVLSKHREAYPFQGQVVWVYAFQIRGDNKAHRIACTEQMMQGASAPGGRARPPGL